MIYRILGAVSLAVGGIFGLIAALILLPFISNFNMGLLVLSAVFGILAYVLISVGWQLYHPYAPEAASGREESQELEVGGVDLEQQSEGEREGVDLEGDIPVAEATSDMPGERPLTPEEVPTGGFAEGEMGVRAERWRMRTSWTLTMISESREAPFRLGIE